MNDHRAMVGFVDHIQGPKYPTALSPACSTPPATTEQLNKRVILEAAFPDSEFAPVRAWLTALQLSAQDAFYRRILQRQISKHVLELSVFRFHLLEPSQLGYTRPTVHL